ncbi:MAG: 50S ribosome-binding GTPase [Planctomycetales bacterium]|nr:50S ribosome-binding GTPase [Planctomycetales bacterium]
MPANLTPQYRKAEDAFRRAQSVEDELRCLIVMLQELPKHKGTDKLQAELRKRISETKKAVDAAKSGKRGFGIRIPHQGAGRIVLVGGPNAGKSQFLKQVTRATTVVAEYPFSTTEPQAAMMPWEDVMIQLVDTPPITTDFLEPYMQGLIRGADLVLMMVDGSSPAGMTGFQDAWRRIEATRTRLGHSSYLDERDIGVSYTRTIIAVNKADLAETADGVLSLRRIAPDTLPIEIISAKTGQGVERLTKQLFAALDVVRVYTKSPNEKQPQMRDPFTIRSGSTLMELAELVHQDFAKGLKFAKVWGSAVHPGTVVKANYQPQDQDIIELHL